MRRLSFVRRSTGSELRALASVLVASLTLGTGGCGFTSPEPDTVVIYAATSLRGALEQLAPAIERDEGLRITFNFGASSDLARQIQAARRADLFVSADEEWMDRLVQDGLVDTDSRLSFLSNRLVVVVPSDSELQIAQAADLLAPALRRLALAQPETVPAGRYAKLWLERSGVWEGVRERIVPGIDVRAALVAVESGGVEAGIVYATEAKGSRRIRVAYTVPEADLPRISYAIAALRDRPQVARSRRVVEWLVGPRAVGAFEERGFIVGGVWK